MIPLHFPSYFRSYSHAKCTLNSFKLVCLIIIFQIICIALIAIHISGSSKLCSAYGAHLFTSPRVVMVWIMVRKCYKIQGKNHWSLQQSHDKGTQASGKHSYPWAYLPSLQITVPPPSSLLSLSISVCSLSFSQGARRIVPEWQDLDFEARQFTAKVSGEVDPQEPVTPPKQSQDPITDSSPEEDDQESKSELWWISTIFSSLEHFDGKPKALSHNIIYPKNILHFNPETVCFIRDLPGTPNCKEEASNAGEGIHRLQQWEDYQLRRRSWRILYYIILDMNSL